MAGRSALRIPSAENHPSLIASNGDQTVPPPLRKEGSFYSRKDVCKGMLKKAGTFQVLCTDDAYFWNDAMALIYRTWCFYLAVA